MLTNGVNGYSIVLRAFFVLPDYKCL